MSAVLLVEGLRTHFFTKAGVVKAVDDVSFSIDAAGEIDSTRAGVWIFRIGSQRQEEAFGCPIHRSKIHNDDEKTR